jgi:hypothetical protein
MIVLAARSLAVKEGLAVLVAAIVICVVMVVVIVLTMRSRDTTWLPSWPLA